MSYYIMDGLTSNSFISKTGKEKVMSEKPDNILEEMMLDDSELER